LQIAYDYSRGLDFLEVISVEDLKLNNKVVHKGSPSGNKYLKNVFQGIEINKDESILDIGSAKGSALKVMLDFPFQNIDGIEISSKLAAISIKNFQKLKTDKVKIFNLDASCFQHYNNYKYFYLYNPFPEVTLKRVFSQMNRQIKGKTIFVIYNNPTCHELLINSNFLLVKKCPDEWGNGINLYKYLFENSF
jgi:16S rRNA A1518/A1519 N6-dimethyltransferase RsmA/KsgA/DIM1 with predicted DNA glycosylase/AP lyase activity